MKYLKMFLRFLCKVVAGIVLLPIILIALIYFLVISIKAAKMINGTVKDGLWIWLQHIKCGLKIDKDFIVNGL